jgi:site-specific DNA recombinase
MPRVDPSRKRCAIYTRKSSEEGLEQEFNSLQAQCEACEAYCSKRHHDKIAAGSGDTLPYSGGRFTRHFRTAREARYRRRADRKA